MDSSKLCAQPSALPNITVCKCGVTERGGGWEASRQAEEERGGVGLHGWIEGRREKRGARSVLRTFCPRDGATEHRQVLCKLPTP